MLDMLVRKQLIGSAVALANPQDSQRVCSCVDPDDGEFH